MMWLYFVGSVTWSVLWLLIGFVLGYLFREYQASTHRRRK